MREFAALEVEPNRPPLTPVGPLVIKSPDASNRRCRQTPIGRNGSSVPRARSQSATPRSVPTASTRPSRWIDACS